jgi:hypothetical protein
MKIHTLGPKSCFRCRNKVTSQIQGWEKSLVCWLTTFSVCADLIRVFIVLNMPLDAFRKNTFELVSRAFACLHVTEAQKLLGLGRKEVLASELDG